MANERFDKHVLETLNEDELALLYMMHSKLFDREHVDLRSVFVQPVMAEIQSSNATSMLTSEGVEARDRVVSKVCNYFR